MMRSSGPKRRKPIKRSNAARKRSEFERAYHSRERVAWVKRQRCAVTGIFGDIENVHCRGGGAGRKADARYILPMAAELHRVLHRIGIRSFESQWGVNLEELAERTHAAWQSHLARPSERPTGE